MLFHVLIKYSYVSIPMLFNNFLLRFFANLQPVREPQPKQASLQVSHLVAGSMQDVQNQQKWNQSITKWNQQIKQAPLLFQPHSRSSLYLAVEKHQRF